MMKHIQFSNIYKSVLSMVWMLFLILQIPANGQSLSDRDEVSTPLFSCETNRKGKFIQIRGIEEGAGQKWSDIQYSFGRDHEAPEMVYPSDPANGATSLFYSHTNVKFQYKISIRFSTGDYTYRVFSYSDGFDAGVMVSDAKGRQVNKIRCIERPYLLAAYLQRTLACDLKNPYGKAACGEKAYQPKSDLRLLGIQPGQRKSRK
jgi:hypothetical protein